MALVERELIERDDLEAVEVDGPQFAQQAGAIDLLDRLPVESEVPGHVAQRHDLAARVVSATRGRTAAPEHPAGKGSLAAAGKPSKDRDFDDFRPASTG